jgi:hypothetical protein
VVGDIVFIRWIRRALPESPRWLAQKGRRQEADSVMTALEMRVACRISAFSASTGSAGARSSARPDAMLVALLAVTVMGPRTRNLALEQISN